MATYTSNYQLHQWVPEDDFLRTDFNTDFQKIDAALAGLEANKAAQSSLAALQSSISAAQSTANGRARAILGSYTGNGAETRSISVGASPKAVILSWDNNSDTALKGGGAVRTITVTSNGFRTDDATMNVSGMAYTYLAIVGEQGKPPGRARGFSCAWERCV